MASKIFCLLFFLVDSHIRLRQLSQRRFSCRFTHSTTSVAPKRRFSFTTRCSRPPQRCRNGISRMVTRQGKTAFLFAKAYCMHVFFLCGCEDTFGIAFTVTPKVQKRVHAWSRSMGRQFAKAYCLHLFFLVILAHLYGHSKGRNEFTHGHEAWEDRLRKLIVYHYSVGFWLKRHVFLQEHGRRSAMAEGTFKMLRSLEDISDIRIPHAALEIPLDTDQLSSQEGPRRKPWMRSTRS